jgi:hypothetical protein
LAFLFPPTSNEHHLSDEFEACVKKREFTKSVPDPADIFIALTEHAVTWFERLTKREPAKQLADGVRRTRAAIKRTHAGEYLFLCLMSLGATVGVTRLFLELSGYPQIGNAELHIAHVLWGGLGVFIGALLMMVLSNPWVYPVSAIFSGVGMGLFIDEVGKFITQSNDYFYPAAAPIIYIIFLLTTWLYLRIRRPASREPRAVMYRALEGLCEILDHDLEERELATLQTNLKYVEEHSGDDDLVAIAGAIRGVISQNGIEIHATQTTLLDRWRDKRDRFMERWIPRNAHRWIAGLGLFTMGLVAMSTPFQLMRASISSANLEPIIQNVLDQGIVQIPSSPGFFSVWISLEGSIGVALWVAAFVLHTRNERLGIFLGQRTLVGYLAIVNIIVFYFQQFSWVPIVLTQFFLLWILKNYKLRGFIDDQDLIG